MSLALITRVLPFILFPFLSCDKNMELFPEQCDCAIEPLRLSQPSAVTYQVSAHDEASVSSITYQTSDGPVTTHHASLPFSTTVQLNQGEIIALVAKGNPGQGSIILTYEIKDSASAAHTLGSSVSRAWISKDGSCQ